MMGQRERRVRTKVEQFAWGLTGFIGLLGLFWARVQQWSLNCFGYELGEFENWDALAVASGTLALMAGRRWSAWKRFFVDYLGLVLVIAPLAVPLIPGVSDFWEQMAKAAVAAGVLILLARSWKDLPVISDQSVP
ncbi:hypothetical protein [Rathayibacter sp. SD072]|uniref:hypothetical protein n=1 Tax=Rathayibacter sp. SD072 TaxID=2781731 RepID=UPI001A95F468|nr:hypothetical protein [Rathayibacter sp. SD072]MBO0984917.1 hypothetical protein [Rathayibacter sp. SD072]